MNVYRCKGEMSTEYVQSMDGGGDANGRRRRAQPHWVLTYLSNPPRSGISVVMIGSNGPLLGKFVIRLLSADSSDAKPGLDSSVASTYEVLRSSSG